MRPLAGSISTRSPPAALAARTARASSRSRNRFSVRLAGERFSLRSAIVLIFVLRQHFRQQHPKTKDVGLSATARLWLSLPARSVAVHKKYFHGGYASATSNRITSTTA